MFDILWRRARTVRTPPNTPGTPYPGRMESMIAASLTSPGSLTLDTRPIPALGEREVLLTVEATTLCGTDLRIMTGQKTNGVSPGVILGHEIAARVWRVGPGLRAGIDVPAPGTQVGLAPQITCGHCAPCSAGIDIAAVNKFRNLAQVQGEIPETVREHYRTLAHHASECIGCGLCEPRCPFGVEIVEAMRRAAERFGY